MVTIIVIIVIALLVIEYFMPLNFSSLSKPPELPIPAVSVARNWAGYAVATNFLTPQPNVQGVSASWNVPTVENTGTNAYSSVWIGVGGQFDKTLIQVGTEQDYTNGAAQYSAWYEMLPSNSVSISSMHVSPGDQMSASISLVDSNTNLWFISMQDLSTHESFQSNFTYSSEKLSAEWIVERPEINNALSQLADFSGVTFTDCQATLSGKTGGITDFSYNIVVMDPQIINNRSVQLVNISGFKNAGTQFTVSYSAT